MIDFKVSVDLSELAGLLGQLNNRQLMNVMEAEVRRWRNRMVDYTLKAPGAGPPARNPLRAFRLRRITGELADTMFIDPQPQQNRVVLGIPSTYAAFHPTVWENFIEEERQPTLDNISRSVGELLRR